MVATTHWDHFGALPSRGLPMLLHTYLCAHRKYRTYHIITIILECSYVRELPVPGRATLFRAAMSVMLWTPHSLFCQPPMEGLLRCQFLLL